MARLVVGAAALLAVGYAASVDIGPKPSTSSKPQQSGDFGWDDSKDMASYTYPNCVPPTDKCCVNCVKICTQGLGRPFRNMVSYHDCQNACWAHSIETPHYKMNPFDTDHQQGKYVQKVMAEYCDRGCCDETCTEEYSGKKGISGLLAQGAEVHEHLHEAKEGDAYSPNTWKGDPRAMPSGWPSYCETKTYYCQQFCQNIYHKPTSDIGEHPGSTPEWQEDLDKCNQDCLENWSGKKGMQAYWDKWCKCYESPGGDMDLEKVPGLLQEGREVEAVDVGSFMQLREDL